LSAASCGWSWFEQSAVTRPLKKKRERFFVE
jgi:hypothetical protein